MAKATDFGIIKAPDGFYFGRLLKSGMMAADNRKVSDEEIIEMFLDVLKRNKAETGRSVMTIFSKRVPVLMAKLDPDIRETGVLPKQQLTPEQKMVLQKQYAKWQQAQQARNAKMPPLQVGKFGEPQS